MATFFLDTWDGIRAALAWGDAAPVAPPDRVPTFGLRTNRWKMSDVRGDAITYSLGRPGEGWEWAGYVDEGGVLRVPPAEQAAASASVVYGKSGAPRAGT